MKKILAALAFVAASTAALATDVTVNTGITTGIDSNVGSVAIGKQFGPVRGEVSLGRTFKYGREANIYGLGVSYPLTEVRGVTLAAKAGLSYVDNHYASAFRGISADGYALSAGLEASYPLTKTLTAVATLERVAGQQRINVINGNNLIAGLRYSF